MARGYQIDRAWSDQFIPSIKNIVGPYLLVESDEITDQQKAADLIVFTGRNLTIAARVRSHEYFDRYPYDFTIRSERESGARTELAKIVDGWGDWMFYGHQLERANGLIRHWMIIDLKSWRAQMIRHRPKSPSDAFSQDRDNFDGTRFRVFDARKFGPQPPLLIASSFDIPGQTPSFGIAA